MALFSIITVTWNNLDGLRKTANSVQAQTSSDYEWIIIDSASEDGTANLLKTLTAQIISEPDTGIYNAMNKGIERATGDYLLFLNAGDQLAGPESLQEISENLSDCPDFVYGDALEEADGGHFTKPARSHHTLALGMFTHHQAMLYRRESLGVMRYNESYKIAADYDLTARLLLKISKHPVDEPQANSDKRDPEKRVAMRNSPMDTRCLNDAPHHRGDAMERIKYCAFPFCIFEAGGVSQRRAKEGRTEQYAIRKALRLSNLLSNATLYALQSFIWMVRSTFPKTYWRLKSRTKA